MRVVGLTGGIASGKSTVAKLFVELGGRLVDADLLARSVVEPGQPAWGEIVDHFGDEVLNPDQSLNREKLAAVVFRDAEKRELLNRITHPRIGAEMLELIQRHQNEGAPVVFIDAALLLESPATAWIRPVVVVAADEEVRLERIMARDGLTRGQAEDRIRSQMSDAERRARADYLIENSGSREELRRRVEEVWAELSRPEAAPAAGDAGGEEPIKGENDMTAERRQSERRGANRRSGTDRRKAGRAAPDRRGNDRRRGDRRKGR